MTDRICQIMGGCTASPPNVNLLLVILAKQGQSSRREPLLVKLAIMDDWWSIVDCKVYLPSH